MWVARFVVLFVPSLFIAYIIRSVSYSATTTQSSAIITIPRKCRNRTWDIAFDRLRRVDYALDKVEIETLTLENEIAYFSRAREVLLMRS